MSCRGRPVLRSSLLILGKDSTAMPTSNTPLPSSAPSSGVAAERRVGVPCGERSSWSGNNGASGGKRKKRLRMLRYFVILKCEVVKKRHRVILKC